MLFSDFRPNTHENFQPNHPTKDSVIVPQQKASQKRYLLDVIVRVNLNATNGIIKATTTKQSDNWDRWRKLLKHSVIAEKFLGGIPQEHKTTPVSSFAASVQRNQFVTIRKKILLHRTVKYAISDVSASFRTHLRSNPTLEYSGQTPLLLQRQLWGYKTPDPTTKHQKDIPENPVLHIYKQKNTHLNTSIGQLIAGAFSLAWYPMSTQLPPKGRTHTHTSFRRGIYHFYRKCHKLPHDSGILHLDDKVSPIFRTQKKRVKNATVTQWRTTTTLCSLRIWEEIIIPLDSYPVTTRDTPVNTVWVDHQKTAITSKITPKYLRSVTPSFGK